MNKNIFNPNSDKYLNYGYLMLPLSLNIVSKIRIGSETFFNKSGYHVSLLCLEDLSVPDQNMILNFTRKYPVKLKKITKIFRLVKQENRKAIIVRVRLKGLKKLISAVNKHFGYNFVYPPTHVTLFTLKDQYGIAVNSISEYRKLTCQIGRKYSQRLAESFKLIY
jgi:hypothetical protein